MALSPKTTRAETVKSAATILAALLLLGLSIVLLGGSRFWEKRDMYDIRFRSVKDLNPGREVKYAGLTVGRVVRIGVDEADPAYILVRIGVRQGFPLLEGTRATIAQRGLVGDYYIALLPGDKGGRRLAPGEQIPPATAGGFDDLAQEANRLLSEQGPQIGNVTRGLERLLTEENTRSVGGFLTRLPGLVDDVRNSLASMDQSLKLVTADVRRGVDAGVATLNRVGPQAENTLITAERALAQVDALSRTLAGDLEVDQERLGVALDSLETMSREVTAMVRSMRERPWQFIYIPEGADKR